MRTRRHREGMTPHSGGYLERPAPSGLADVIETLLDKGMVIDAYARVSLLGIELLTVDARIVVASVDTYLRFAEATNRLDLYEHGGKGLVEVATDSIGTVAHHVAERVVEDKVSGAVDAASDAAVAVADQVTGAVDAASDAVSDLLSPPEE